MRVRGHESLKPDGLQGDLRLSLGFEPRYEVLKVAFKKDAVASSWV